MRLSDVYIAFNGTPLLQCHFLLRPKRIMWAIKKKRSQIDHERLLRRALKH